MSWLADALRLTSLKTIDVDAPERLSSHAQALAGKPMLRKVFADFHESFERLDRQFLTGKGMRLEIGAGIAPMRDSYPDVLATDVVDGPGLDRIIDAQKIDLPDVSVRTIFGQNCFHHLPDPQSFFREIERVVETGGGLILLEPYHGPLASYVFKRLFQTEGFDKSFPAWETPVLGPMNGANQALSYIVFERDRALFEERFPNLKIVHTELCSNYLGYVLSGGLNFRQLCPNWAAPAVYKVQSLLSIFNKWFALHHIIVIRKED